MNIECGSGWSADSQNKTIMLIRIEYYNQNYLIWKRSQTKHSSMFSEIRLSSPRDLLGWFTLDLTCPKRFIQNAFRLAVCRKCWCTHLFQHAFFVGCARFLPISETKKSLSWCCRSFPLMGASAAKSAVSQRVCHFWFLMEFLQDQKITYIRKHAPGLSLLIGQIGDSIKYSGTKDMEPSST